MLTEKIKKRFYLTILCFKNIIFFFNKTIFVLIINIVVSITVKTVKIKFEKSTAYYAHLQMFDIFM